MITAQFKVTAVTHMENDMVEVTMIPGRGSFTKYTPSGKISFVSTNPEVNKQLIPGKVFQVDFREVEAE